MKTYVLIFAAAFLISVVTTVIVRAVARRLGILDRPDRPRKVHTRPVPSLGGLAIYVAFFAPFAGFLFYQNAISDQLLLHLRDAIALFAASTVVLAVGMMDDVRGLSTRYKLSIELLAALLLFFTGYQIRAVSNPFGGPIDLGNLCLPVTVFWLMGSSNAFNLIDGLDGLAAGVGLFACATIFFVAIIFGNTLTALFMISMAGALLGFLLFNFHPASIFLGDSGSLFLGFVIGAIALKGSQKSATVVALLIPVLALGLPIMDTVLAILRRWSQRLPISHGDRQHLHHRLLSLGLSHRHAVWVLYGACGFLAAIAMFITAAGNAAVAITLGVAGVIVFTGVRLVGGVKLADLKSRLDWDRKQAKWRRRAWRLVDEAGDDMNRACTPAELWQSLTRTLRELEFEEATMSLKPPYAQNGSEPLELSWARPSPPAQERDGSDPLSVRLLLQTDSATLGDFALTKAGGVFMHDVLAVANAIRNRAALRIEAMCQESSPAP
jgi:UDP-GlcNAc:undecaprenyl-phosphate GlcNAc-1-phosphate transferase